MKSCLPRLAVLTFFLFHYCNSDAQDQRAFNQNASRSNHTRIFNQNASRSNHSRLSFSLSPTFSVNSNGNTDTLSFRGSGGGFRMGAEYYFGALGLSVVSGISSSSVDQAKVNQFLKTFPIPASELLVQKANQQNGYLLMGPTVRFGNTVEAFAHAQGGLFINNGGLLDIRQKGNSRSAYRNEPTGRAISAGYLAGGGFNYGAASRWAFGFTIDYLATRILVNNYDVRRGGAAEPLRLSSRVSDVMLGITARYQLPLSPQTNGRKKHIGNVKYQDISARETGSGQATGRRMQEAESQEVQADPSSASCGAVTKRITHPDGTVEETNFACVADAAAYEQGMNKNAADAMRSNGVIHRDLAARNIIAGQITWSPAAANGIITNTTSRSISERQTPQTSFGSIVRLSTRETGTGIATGRRQYQPFFAEGSGNVCNPCIATAKLSSVHNNPLYSDKGLSGTNPLNKTATNSNSTEEEGQKGFVISLIETHSGAIVAQTLPETDGQFFFAEVPDGDYLLRTEGQLHVVKVFEINLAAAADIAGSIDPSSTPAAQMVAVKTGARTAATDGDEIWSPRSNVSIVPVVSGVTVNCEAGDGKKVMIQADDHGRFEFSNLSPGHYFISISQTITLANESAVMLAGNKSANGHNSSRSNKSASTIDQPDDVLSPGRATPGIEKKAAITSGNIRSLLTSLDMLEEQLIKDEDISRAAVKANCNTIRQHRAAAYLLLELMDNVVYDHSSLSADLMAGRMAAFDQSAHLLFDALSGLGSGFSAITNVLKTRHDTVKNSINNVR